ncbi:serine O-acetyltransferase [Ligilactobacillus ruminis]|jgi:serine O-acetyltransferase|uniref:serine O-acetyltransferase n=1 Tax=Ligilactobacillus ruminis TaxID=1623 RepID=UPI003B9B5798
MSIRDYLLPAIKGFNYDKYWNRRDKIFEKKTPKILKMYYLFYLRRMDAKNGADINILTAAKENNFKGHPILGHGIKGIVIAGEAKIGKNVEISHQVTIGRSKGGVPTIGDDVYIGPGAKIFGGIKIGNNVRIGANCVVFEDVPDNATVVLQKPRVIIKDPDYHYSIFEDTEEHKKG